MALAWVCGAVWDWIKRRRDLGSSSQLRSFSDVMIYWTWLSCVG